LNLEKKAGVAKEEAAGRGGSVDSSLEKRAVEPGEPVRAEGKRKGKNRK